MSKVTAVRELLGYLAENHHTIHYTGWVGYQNLGDEILLEAAVESFAPAKIVWVRGFHNKLIQAVVARKKHDLAMLGGGTQIGERSPIVRFKNAIAASKSAFVFGAGVTPSTDGPIPAWLEQWGEVLRPLPYVGVRGLESAATLARVGVNAQAMGDPVCWFVKPQDYWQPEEGLVGINVGHAHGHMYGQENVIQSQIIEMVKDLLAKGKRLEFFCVWPEDLETTRRVAAAAGVKDPIIHEIYEGALRFQEKVRRMELFVGIKLHAVALAMCTNVPSLMIEYRPKCREFATTLGVERFCVRSDSLDVAQMLELISVLQDQGREVSRTMHAHATVIRDRIRELSKSILSSNGW